jgi:hypothetical protein
MNKPRDIAAAGNRLDVRRWLRTPEGQAQLKELLAPVLPRILPWVELLVERIAEISLQIRQRAAQYSGPPTPGHETFLVEQGYEVAWAKVMATALTKLGDSFAEEWNGVRKPLGTAVRRISQAADKSPLVMSRRARELKALLQHGASHAMVGTALAKVGVTLNLEDLRGLVDRAGNRDKKACAELAALSQAMLAHLPDPRGRPMSGETAIHVLLLEDLKERGKPYGYTWSPEKEDFVDGATRATRISCGSPNFDPRPAHRLLRSGAICEYDGPWKPPVA